MKSPVSYRFSYVFITGAPPNVAMLVDQEGIDTGDQEPHGRVVIAVNQAMHFHPLVAQHGLLALGRPYFCALQDVIFMGK